MTDVGRMSVGELVGKVLADEHADVASATRIGWPAAMAIGSGPATPRWGRPSWPSPSLGQARTSRATASTVHCDLQGSGQHGAWPPIHGKWLMAWGHP